MPSQFARTLVAWRRANNIKQASLAAQLGVSQQALSAWERGLSIPSPHVMGQIRTMISRGDPLGVDLAFIKRQSSVRALFDADGARLMGYSAGFERLWAPFCAMKDVYLQDKLTNELRSLVEDNETRRQVESGDLVIVSGVSDRHVTIDLGGAFRHRWSIRFRRYGHRMIGDMVFEHCDPAHPVGVDAMIRADEVVAC